MPIFVFDKLDLLVERLQSKAVAYKAIADRTEEKTHFFINVFNCNNHLIIRIEFENFLVIFGHWFYKPVTYEFTLVVRPSVRPSVS